MNKYNQITEQRIDEEIARRVDRVYIHHVRKISDKIDGITLVTNCPHSYWKIVDYLDRVINDIVDEHGDIYPGDMKHDANQISIGIAICSKPDQFNRQEGRIRAKRNWLRFNK